MHLRLALLALLAVQPMTGFDLVRLFDVSVGNFWHAPHTQIYPELRKLEAAGSIVGQEIPRGTRATKTLYEITDSGRAQLQTLLDTVEVPRRDRDPHKLRAANFEWARPESVYSQLRVHERYFGEALALYEQVREDLLARRVPLLRAQLEARRRISTMKSWRTRPTPTPG